MLEATLQVLQVMNFMPSTACAQCPQPRKARQESSLAQALLEQSELRSRRTATFFPADMIPETAVMQDKTKKCFNWASGVTYLHYCQ